MTGKAACTAFLILAAIALGKADVVSHTESLTSDWNSAFDRGEGEEFVNAVTNYTDVGNKILEQDPLDELDAEVASVLTEYNIDQTDYATIAQSFQEQNPDQQLNFLGSLLGTPLRLMDKVVGSIYREDGSNGQAGRKLLGSWGRA